MAIVKSIKNRGKPKKNVKKTRKEDRKEKRKLKKVLRNDYYTNKNKNDGKFVKNPANSNEKNEGNLMIKKTKSQSKSWKSKDKDIFTNDIIRDQQKEKRHEECLKNEMFKQRKKQLQDANEMEDENIRMLEKQLNLKKKNKKSIPKSFAEDGLDYLLELCEPETLAQAAKTEKQLAKVQNVDEFDEDIEIALGKANITETTDISSKDEGDFNDLSSMDDSDSELGDEFNGNLDSRTKNSISLNSEDEDVEFDEEMESDDSNDLCLKLENCVSDSSESEDSSIDEKIAYDCLSLGYFPDGVFRPENLSPIVEETKTDLEIYNKGLQNKRSTYKEKYLDNDAEVAKSSIKRKGTKANAQANEKKQKKSLSSEDESSDEDVSEDENGDLSSTKDNNDETWEDIYGRKRDKKGNVIEEKTAKYVPPQARARALTTEQSEKVQRLKRQIKGLLNKLTEQNMHSIATELEGVYMSNSRHDTSDALTNLSLEFLIGARSIPDVMMAHHAMLISILHANVGTEVGAFYLQIAVKKFDELLSQETSVDNKKLDNVVGLLSQLYNFKIFSSPLLLEILTKLSKNLNEKSLDCVLVVLRTSGFFLRKEDPSSLKEIILKLQAIANSAPTDIKNNFRMKFMLDVLLAIKNNNVSKIPSYDHTQSEHLRKVVKNHYRKGNYISTLNITLDDLLKAEENGRWWLIGSAWSGDKINESRTTQTTFNANVYSQKLLDLAKEQRMNTDIRKNIFCTIMSAEDYLDAFEKILHLGLKGSQEREVSHVLLSCCLQEKTYNPYYSVLAQKFCDTDRKYQISLQYSLWDKLRDLASLTALQLKNLAKFLIHLFIELGLPISILKIIEFSELQKLELRLMRQILLGILLNPAEASVKQVFERVSVGPKLKLFRQGLRLFLHHFLMGDANTSSKINEENKALLKQRVNMVDQVLSVGESRVHF